MLIICWSLACDFENVGRRVQIQPTAKQNGLGSWAVLNLLLGSLVGPRAILHTLRIRMPEFEPLDSSGVEEIPAIPSHSKIWEENSGSSEKIRPRLKLNIGRCLTLSQQCPSILVYYSYSSFPASQAKGFHITYHLENLFTGDAED